VCHHKLEKKHRDGHGGKTHIILGLCICADVNLSNLLIDQTLVSAPHDSLQVIAQKAVDKVDFDLGAANVLDGQRKGKILFRLREEADQLGMILQKKRIHHGRIEFVYDVPSQTPKKLWRPATG
jgi:hypothetical protein